MLKLKEVKECYYPTSLDEAVNILKEHGEKAKIVGGGLHITVFPNPLIETLIFLNKLNLSYVKEGENSISIGAMTTITELAESEVMKQFLGGTVSTALFNIASELLRNQITVGGSVVQREPYSDITTLLCALKAKIVVFDGGEREFTIDDFFNKDLRSTLKNTIVKEVKIDKFDSSCRFGMERYTRNATDISLLNMAVLSKIEDGIIKDASVAYGSRPMPTERFTQLEEFLKGKSLDEAINGAYNFVKEHADVKGDVRTAEEYRREIAGVFAKRILESFRR